MEALEAADQYLQNQTGHPLVFKCGNRMDPSWLASDRAVLTGEDKRRYMLQVISQMGSHCPLVIGNDAEDMGLVEVAREMGGVSHGFDPKPQLAAQFDLASTIGNAGLPQGRAGQARQTNPLVGWKLSFATNQSRRIVEPVLELPARPLPVKRMSEMLVVTRRTLHDVLDHCYATTPSAA